MSLHKPAAGNQLEKAKPCHLLIQFHHQKRCSYIWFYNLVLLLLLLFGVPGCTQPG
jgi:hypothetical protein